MFQVSRADHTIIKQSSLTKASFGHLRVLGKRGLFLPPLRTAPAGFDYLPEHQKDVVYVSVSDSPITVTHTLYRNNVYIKCKYYGETIELLLLTGTLKLPFEICWLSLASR